MLGLKELNHAILLIKYKLTKLQIVSILYCPVLDKNYNQLACLQHNTVNAACSSNMAGTAHSASRKLQNEQNPKCSIEQNKRDNCVFIIAHHEQIAEHLSKKFSDSGKISHPPSCRFIENPLIKKETSFPIIKGCGSLGNED